MSWRPSTRWALRSSQVPGRVSIGRSARPRSTQFFDLSLLTAQAMAKLPVIPVPTGFSFQPVDADEVAARLVELALGAPAGLVPAIAGPRVYDWAELIRGYLRAAGKSRPIIRVPLLGKAAAAIRTGANLAPDRAVGRRTWEEILAAHVSGRRELAVDSR